MKLYELKFNNIFRRCIQVIAFGFLLNFKIYHFRKIMIYETKLSTNTSQLNNIFNGIYLK
jgi:hypothetical protein